ncbi:MAG TPA: helix-turn-helix domain-containing protein [Acidimicrobiales bacterium]|nr:helix-turn-helix domain-containing protein [Acidimicrobiales bacterium]
MTVARSVGDVLDEHVVFDLECIDRLYLNLYQPKLVYPSGVVGFFRGHRGMPFASSALMDPISKDFVAGIHRFIDEWGLDLVHFQKGQRKDDVTHHYLAGHDGSEGVLYVGRAQEKTRVFRTEKRHNPSTGVAYPWLVSSTAMINHFYFYGFDTDFGPFFVKFGTYFPYTAKVCLNGHHWAQQQAGRAGIAFTALDNAFAACDDPRRLQRVCDRLGPGHIERFCRKWLARLPHPFTVADRRAGYRYQVSVLQAEFSLTQVLDRPHTARVFFEKAIRDNLDAGRPDQISLTFDRRIITKGPARTPSRFRTRVITDGVIPSIHLDYKHSRIKQYIKHGPQGVALRTECTINDSRDFGIGRLLPNLPDLGQIGYTANRRLLQVQRISSDPITGADTYQRVCQPVIIDGQRIPALRFDAPATQALLTTMVVCRLLPNGFANRDLRALLAPALGLPPSAMTQGRMSYHLRRLRHHGLIERIPHTHRYTVTEFGLAAAIFLTRAHNRFLGDGLAQLVGPDPPTPLRQALNRLDTELKRHAQHSGLAA